MTELKERRQRAIADLIRTHALASQEELAERLSALGYAVTQATISRDLEQMGAVKVRRGGQLSYALPDDTRVAPSRLASVFGDWVRSVESAGNLVVIKTPPGSAHLVGVVLDQSELPKAIGWNALLAGTKAKGIHADDLPQAQNLVIPEWSHLSRKCATVFTDVYVRRLVQLTTRLKLRADAPPPLSRADCVPQRIASL